jgi:hypothetical protein
MAANDRSGTAVGAYRRVFGLALGALLGLVFGFVSQAINRIALPGLPLHQPPLGPAGNVLLIALLGAALGGVAAWPAGSIPGVFMASAVAAVLITLVSFLGVQLTDRNQLGMIVTGIFMLLPLIGLMAPMLGLFRWTVNKELEAQREAAPAWRHLRLPLSLAVVLALLGALSLLPGDAQQELTAMDALLKAGLAARNPGARAGALAGALPASLAGEDVGDFLAQARGAYALEWTRNNLNRFRIPRPGRNFDSHAVVVAHFANGWRLACLFVTPSEPPECKSTW